MTLNLIINTNIKDDNGFTDLVNDIVADVQANEPTTLGYNFVRTGDGTALFCETYASGNDFLAHVERIGAAGYLDRLMACADITTSYAWGDVTPGVKDVLAGFGTTICEVVGGFERNVITV